MNEEFPVKCLVDNTKYKCVEHLHLYLRKLKIKQADYYQKYFPRYDKFTKELIPYKDYEQYFNTDFLNKNNIKKYLKQYPDDGKIWAIDFLKKRKKQKNLIYPPTQVELRSLPCPTMHYYESIGGYNSICKELGYQIKFNNPILKFNKLDKNSVIICDTREQKELEINGFKIINKALKFGDYALEKKNEIFIERKSISDMIGTLSKGLERFKRELNRAKKADSYIVILVEGSIGEALGFNFLPQYRWIKTNPAHIFKNIRDLMFEFDNIQFLFVDNRKEASLALIKIFELGTQVKDCDLHFLYESGILKFENSINL